MGCVLRAVGICTAFSDCQIELSFVIVVWKMSKFFAFLHAGPAVSLTILNKHHWQL